MKFEVTAAHIQNFNRQIPAVSQTGSAQTALRITLNDGTVGVAVHEYEWNGIAVTAERLYVEPIIADAVRAWLGDADPSFHKDFPAFPDSLGTLETINEMREKATEKCFDYED